MARVTLCLGLPKSGKTFRCLQAYAQRLGSATHLEGASRCLWLTPARESRQVVLEQLLRFTPGVAMQPEVLTFDSFAEQVLQDVGHLGRAITSMERRTLLRHVLRELNGEGRFQYFRQMAHAAGFLEVVSNFITELKRAEIWPETLLEACRNRFGSAGRRDVELCGIYARYQDILLARNWYDSEGRFWLARTEMQNATDGFWKRRSLIVIDGFSDFTRTQQEMLEQLALDAERLIITLPMEHPLARQELFAKPRGVAGELQRLLAITGPIETVRCPEVPRPLPAGLLQIQRRLFENPRTVQRTAPTREIAVLGAVGDRAEQAAVALRIKALLTRGVSPRDIVIGLRNVSGTGESWRTYLGEAGLPVWCEAAPPWSRSPYLKALFSLLQLEMEDWPFLRLQQVLNSSFFRPRLPRQPWQPVHSAIGVTGWLRRLNLHSHRGTILRLIQRRRDFQDSRDSEELRASLLLTHETLAELSEACEVLRRPQTLHGWADALGRLTARLGLTQSPHPADQRDADQLQRLIRTAAEMEAELAQPPPERDLSEVLDILREMVQAGANPVTTRAEGRIRIVGAESLRHLEPRHLFLAELTEDAFPSRRSDDCLYSETDRLMLHGDGLLLSHRELHQREEMLLFYQAVTRATESLTLSFSRVNAQGNEVYPSPYLTAVLDLFEPKIELERAGSLDPLPELNAILTPADLRLAAVEQARAQRRPSWWRLLWENQATREMAENVLASARLAQHRFQTDGFTPYEGRLVHPRHREDLAQKFSSRREFSATELESFAACPFRFWLSHVLGLAPLSAPEVATDHASRGSLVHDVLAKLETETTASSAEMTARFRQLVEERLQHQTSDNDLQQALLRIERELLHRMAEAFGQQHETYLEKVSEQQLSGLRSRQEIPFGTARDADRDAPQDRYPPVIVGTGTAAIYLSGRIDRIDLAVADGEPVFAVIDYKTGKRHGFSLKKLEQGEALQLALYLFAVVRLEIAGPNASPFWLGYWTLKGTGFNPALKKSQAKWPRLDQATWSELESLLSELVPNLVAGIRTGDFVVENKDETCTGFCEFHTVCRVNQIRPIAELRHKQRAPLATPRDDG